MTVCDRDTDRLIGAESEFGKGRGGELKFVRPNAKIVQFRYQINIMLLYFNFLAAKPAIEPILE